MLPNANDSRSSIGKYLNVYILSDNSHNAYDVRLFGHISKRYMVFMKNIDSLWMMYLPNKSVFSSETTHNWFNKS